MSDDFLTAYLLCIGLLCTMLGLAHWYFTAR
jgi:hypothetical protein